MPWLCVLGAEQSREQRELLLTGGFIFVVSLFGPFCCSSWRTLKQHNTLGTRCTNLHRSRLLVVPVQYNEQQQQHISAYARCILSAFLPSFLSFVCMLCSPYRCISVDANSVQYSVRLSQQRQHVGCLLQGWRIIFPVRPIHASVCYPAISLRYPPKTAAQKGQNRQRKS